MLHEYMCQHIVTAGRFGLQDFHALSCRSPLMVLLDFVARTAVLQNGTILDMDEPESHWNIPNYKRDRIIESLAEFRGCNSGQVIVDLEDARGVPPILPNGKIPNIFQYNRHIHHREAILWPLKSYFVPSLNGLGHVNAQNLEDQIDFSDKIPVVFWRGGLSGSYHTGVNKRRNPRRSDFDCDDPSLFTRIDLVKRYLGQEWIDARLVGLPKGGLFEDVGVYFEGRADLREHFRYRFLLAASGNDVGSSLYWMINSNSVVFKEETEYEVIPDYFLRPWIHYIPVRRGLVDLKEKYDFCMENPSMCKEISQRARMAHKEMTRREVWSDAKQRVLERMGVLT